MPKPAHHPGNSPSRQAITPQNLYRQPARQATPLPSLTQYDLCKIPTNPIQTVHPPCSKIPARSHHLTKGDMPNLSSSQPKRNNTSPYPRGTNAQLLVSNGTAWATPTQKHHAGKFKHTFAEKKLLPFTAWYYLAPRSTSSSSRPPASS